MIRVYLRKWHRWLAPVVFIQMLLWIVSGLFFSWNNFNRSLNETDPVLQSLTSEEKIFTEKSDSGLMLGIPAVIDSLRKFGISVNQITSVHLDKLLNDPIAIVSYEDDFNSYRYRLNPVRPLLGISDSEAVRIALEKSGASSIVKSVELKSDFDVFYPSFYYELPVFHVVLNHSENGIIDCYVSPRTGEVLASLKSKNKLNRVMFSWFHIMEYSQSRNGRLWGYGLLFAFSVLMLGSLISGLPLYFKNRNPDQSHKE